MSVAEIAVIADRPVPLPEPVPLLIDTTIATSLRTIWAQNRVPIQAAADFVATTAITLLGPQVPSSRLPRPAPTRGTAPVPLTAEVHARFTDLCERIGVDPSEVFTGGFLATQRGLRSINLRGVDPYPKATEQLRTR